jgi:hypothetical protein
MIGGTGSKIGVETPVRNHAIARIERLVWNS